MKRYLLIGLRVIAAGLLIKTLLVTYVVVLTPQQPQFHSPSGEPIPKS